MAQKFNVIVDVKLANGAGQKLKKQIEDCVDGIEVKLKKPKGKLDFGIEKQAKKEVAAAEKHIRNIMSNYGMKNVNLGIESTAKKEVAASKKIIKNGLSSIQTGKIKTNLGLADAAEREAKEAKHAFQDAKKYAKEAYQITNQANKSRSKGNTTQYDTEIKQVTKLLGLVKDLEKQYGKQWSPRQGELIRQDQEKALRQIERTSAAIKDQARSMSTKGNLKQDVGLFKQQIKLWEKENSAALEKFGTELNKLKAQLNNVDRTKFNNLKKEFKEITNQAKIDGVAHLNFKDRLKQQAQRYAAYFSVASVMMEATMALRQMFQAVRDIDKAMTELYRVSDLTTAQYANLYDDMTASAKKYGAALDDIISATADWTRAGFEPEVAVGLAEVTTMYQHIADLDYDEAVQNLLTSYKGFESELTDKYAGDTVAAVTNVMDILNELDNNYSVTAAGVGEALRRSAASMDVAGNSLEETAALVTGITEVTQDPEMAGNALKVVSMRIRGMKGKLEELGEETDENVENISKMQGQILNLTHGKVNIFDSTGEFKSTYEILQGIASVWDELNSIDQAELLETVAGKHRANAVASLLGNWQNVERALDSALNSEGSALREHDKYVDSIEGRLNKLTAMAQQFSNTFMNSDLIKGVISFLTGFLEVLDKFIESFGLLGTIGVGVAFVGLFKGFSGLVSLLPVAVSSFADLGAFAGLARQQMMGFFGTIAGRMFLLGGLAAGIGLVYNALQQMEQEAAAARQEIIDSSNAFSDAASSFEQAYIKYSGRTALTEEEENELASAIDGTVDALGEKSSALKDVVNASSDYLASLDEIAKAEINQGRIEATKAKQAAATQLKKDLTEYQWLSQKWTAGDFKIAYSWSDEYKAAKDIIESAEFQKHLKSNTGDFSITTHDMYRFDVFDDTSGIIDQYYMMLELQSRLAEEEFTDNEMYESLSEAIDAMSESVGEYQNQLYLSEKYRYQSENGIPKTIDQYYAMRDAILANSGATEEARAAIAGMMDEEFSTSFDLTGIAFQARSLKGVVDGIGDNEVKTFEFFLDMKSKVNDGDATVGEYLSELSGIESMISGFDSSTQKRIKLALGIDFEEDTIKQQYTSFMNTLTRSGITEEAAKEFTNSLSAIELKAAINLVGEEDGKGEVDLSKLYKEDLNLDMREIERELTKLGEGGAVDLLVRPKVDTKKLTAAGFGEFEDGFATVLSHTFTKVSTDKGKLNNIAMNFTPILPDGTVMEKGEFENYCNDVVNGVREDDLNLQIGATFKGADAVHKAEEAAKRVSELHGIYYGDYVNLLQEIEEETAYLEAMSFTIDIGYETSSLEAFNDALAESKSATGLTSESISALETRYIDLEGGLYNSAKLFELTANGIRINSKELNKLERAYAKQKFDDTSKSIETLKKEYDDLTVKVNDYSRSAEQRAKDRTERESIREQIQLLSEQAAMYDGLTSSYQEWQNAVDEKTGSDRDMYSEIQSAMEDVKKELDLGWIDDATKEYFELIWGEYEYDPTTGLSKGWDAAGKSVKDYRNQWATLDDTISGTTYSISDFFKVNADGELTSQGIFNFYKAVGQKQKELGEDWIQFDENGNMVSFDFGVDGEKAVAEALGISEELVEIFMRASEDAGFVVNFDGAYVQLDDFLADAQEAQRKLNEAFADDGIEYAFNFNLESVSEATNQIAEAKKAFAERGIFELDESGEVTRFNVNAEGAKDAMVVVASLQAQLDNMTKDQYYLDFKVEDEKYQEPLEKIQEYGYTVASLNQLKLDPTVNTAEIEGLEKELEDISKWFAKLSDEEQISLGINPEYDEDDWEQLQKDIESGKVTIPTTLDIQAQMGKSLEDLVKLSLVGKNILTEDQEYDLLVSLGVEYDVIENNADDAANQITKGTEGLIKKTTAEPIQMNQLIEGVDYTFEKSNTFTITAETFGIQDVEKLKGAVGELDDKTVQAIARAIGTGDVASLSQIIGNIDDKTAQVIAEAFGYSSVHELQTAILNTDGKELQVLAEVLGITDAETLFQAIDILQNKEVTVEALVDGKGEVSSLKTYIDGLHDKTINIRANVAEGVTGLINKLGGYFASVDGTAHAGGTAFVNGTVSGRAFKQGDWGTKDSGVALGGELGTELLVRNGRWYTIGENGAEFFGHKKGDIIFNAEQTKEIFEKGKITHGSGRGKALASGTAFSDGDIPDEPSYGYTTSYPSNPNSSPSKSSSKKSSSSDSSKEAEEFKETLDWIEIAIDRIERAISRLDLRASSVYKSWGSRNKDLNSQMSEVRKEIDLQGKAYNRYLQEANSVGLSESYASKVRDGTIDIETITDEDLKEKIDEYQQWYEKALDCKDAIDNFNETLGELASQRFDNITTQFDNILGVIEHEKNILEGYITQSETKGWIVSGKYYDALIGNESESISKLKQERQKLTDQLNKNVAEGLFPEYSEEWYREVAAIDEVTEAIQESENAILEWQNSMRDTQWEVFDILQERISDVSSEAEFLIELMSNKKLYGDTGQLTDEGMATMGLHGMNYNVYMNQADRYANEIKKINADLANDPHDQELINRKRELIEAQRESILAAEGEKDAIKDMVEEGINLELDALQESIDLYEERLDSAKDLYDYQKKVAEQTKEIADLEKQMAAYQGDDSEEAKAKIQELKVSLEEAKADLEETEYDRYVSDQQKMLDELYTEYEEILNARLDNIDALMEQMIDAINGDSGSVASTLEEQANKVGIELSEKMNEIWSSNGDGNKVITKYGDGFLGALTTTNAALGNIDVNIRSMIEQLNKLAGTNVEAAGKSSAANKEPEPEPEPTPTPSPTPEDTTAEPTQTTDKSITVGGQINAGSARIYADSYGNGGGRQYFRNDPIYTVLGERNGYLKVRYHKSSSGVDGWFKKSDVSAYATGKRLIDSNELAWTQENGQEMIVRPSDGAILTPLARNDSVLNAAASKNIWDMANNPADFIKNNLGFDSGNANVGGNSSTTYSQTISEVHLNFPQVKNYEQMLSAMQKDKSFQNLIESMTVDRIAGGSKLAKGKVLR